jgi:hypothetical protein
MSKRQPRCSPRGASASASHTTGSFRISRMETARRGGCSCSGARPEYLHGPLVMRSPLPLVGRTRAHEPMIRSNIFGSCSTWIRRAGYQMLLRRTAMDRPNNRSSSRPAIKLLPVARSELAPGARPVPPRPDLIATSDWRGFSRHKHLALGSAWRPASGEKPTNPARGGRRGRRTDGHKLKAIAQQAASFGVWASDAPTRAHCFVGQRSAGRSRRGRALAYGCVSVTNARWISLSPSQASMKFLTRL